MILSLNGGLKEVMHTYNIVNFSILLVPDSNNSV